MFKLLRCVCVCEDIFKKAVLSGDDICQEVLRRSYLGVSPQGQSVKEGVTEG